MFRRELIGDFPLANIEHQFNSYGNQAFMVIIPKTKIYLPSGKHSHESYEFFIPSQNTTCLLNDSIIVVEKDHILPINPGQSHGFSNPQENIHFISIMIDKDYMNNYLSSFGKKHLIFCNEIVPKCGSVDTLVRMFIEEEKYRELGYEIIISNLIIQIALNIIRLTNNNLCSVSNKVFDKKKKAIDKALEVMKKEYSSSLSIEDLAKELGLHPLYFIRLFKSLTGKTPYEFILDLKIEKARELLLIKYNKITDICYLCGFTNQSYFSSIFRKKVGFSPSEYRKRFSYSE